MWDILGIKGLILGFLVFAPLERLIAMHKGQKILRVCPESSCWIA